MRIHMMTKVADRVLEKLREARLPGTFGAYPYANGREHGWTLVGESGANLHRGVTFAENRNSDDIVVYVDTNPWSAGCHVTEDAYRGRRFFHRTAAAVAYIAEILRLQETGG